MTGTFHLVILSFVPSLCSPTLCYPCPHPRLWFGCHSKRPPVQICLYTVFIRLLHHRHSQKYQCPNKKDLFSQVSSTKAYYHLWASFRWTQPLNIYRWDAPTYCKSLLSFSLSGKAYSYYISAAHPTAWAYHSCSSLLPVFLLSPSFNQLISMDLLCAQHCYNHFRWKSRQNVCFIGLIATERQTTDILPFFITLWSI